MDMQAESIKGGYSTDRAPLPPGTNISYADIKAVVVEDSGGLSLIVDSEDGYRVRWYWKFDGESCIVLPPSTDPTKH